MTNQTKPVSAAAMRAAETYLRSIDGNDFGTKDGHSIEDCAAIIDREFAGLIGAAELLLGMAGVWQIDPDKSKQTMNGGFEGLSKALAAVRGE